jgi:signal transduction histidine kinase
LIAGLTGVVVVAVFTRRALAPVRTLTAAAHRIGEGDLAHRVPTNTRNDEVGELSRTFNTMATGLQMAEDRRKKMTADIAHELRTPLTNIQGYLEAMRDGVVAADTETLTTLHMQATHLSRLVDDLRLLSVAEAGALNLELNEDDIASLVNETARAFQPRADAASIQLKVDVTDNLPSVNIDRGRIRQVVGNLVENALSNTPNAGCINISAGRAEQGGVRIEVRDSGHGIPAAQLDRIFEQFYRLDVSRSRATGGAGLGLTIVRRLVEAHGGCVRAESEPGCGAAFIVELPPYDPSS